MDDNNEVMALREELGKLKALCAEQGRQIECIIKHVFDDPDALPGGLQKKAARMFDFVVSIGDRQMDHEKWHDKEKELSDEKFDLFIKMVQRVKALEAHCFSGIDNDAVALRKILGLDDARQVNPLDDSSVPKK